MGRLPQPSKASIAWLAVLSTALLSSISLAQTPSPVIISYPFVIGATRCYSCGFGNFSNRSGAEFCEACVPGIISLLVGVICPLSRFIQLVGLIYPVHRH